MHADNHVLVLLVNIVERKPMLRARLRAQVNPGATRLRGSVQRRCDGMRVRSVPHQSVGTSDEAPRGHLPGLENCCFKRGAWSAPCPSIASTGGRAPPSPL
jgi:hypothetical protein